MKNRWAYPIFNLVLLLALPLIGVVILLRWRERVFSKGAERWSERWGRLKPETVAAFAAGGRWWWVHAVSVGEVKAIEAFLRRIAPAAGAKVLLSVVTPEALEWAVRQKVADQVIAAPLDLPWVVRRVFQVIRPEVFVSVESEFWPNLLREAKRSGARVALINGRISASSFRSYRRVRWLMTALWEMIDLFAVRQTEDAERFAALGAPADQIHVTGNLKYDLFLERRTQRRYIAETPVVVMGSTREGEESRLLPAMERVRAQIPQMCIIWAPRHIERVPELEALLKTHALAYHRISDLRAGVNGSEPTPYILWDSMGDLIEAYRSADVAVIGGSFVAKGGQNPIEPAVLRLPVLFGPSMENFAGVADSLVQAGGARRVSLEDLEGQLAALLKDPAECQAMGERAHQAVLTQQGATERTIKLIKELLTA